MALKMIMFVLFNLYVSGRASCIPDDTCKQSSNPRVVSDPGNCHNFYRCLSGAPTKLPLTCGTNGYFNGDLYHPACIPGHCDSPICPLADSPSDSDANVVYSLRRLSNMQSYDSDSGSGYSRQDMEYLMSPYTEVCRNVSDYNCTSAMVAPICSTCYPDYITCYPIGDTFVPVESTCRDDEYFNPNSAYWQCMPLDLCEDLIGEITIPTTSSTASSTPSSTASSTPSSTASSTPSSTASSTPSSTASSTTSTTASSTPSSTASSTTSATESSTTSTTPSSTTSSTPSSTASSTTSATESSTASSTPSSTASSTTSATASSTPSSTTSSTASSTPSSTTTSTASSTPSSTTTSTASSTPSSTATSTTSSTTSSTLSSTSSTLSSTSSSTTPGVSAAGFNCVPEDDCLLASSPALVPDVDNCQQFYVCTSGVPADFPLTCGDGQYFNGDVDDPGCSTGDCISSTCPYYSPTCKTSCAELLPETVGMIVYPNDATKFYLCMNGDVYESDCNGGLFFNGVNCSAEVIEDACGTMCGPPICTTNIETIYNLPDKSDCKRFYVCLDGDALSQPCPIDTTFDIISAECVPDTVDTVCQQYCL